MTKGRLWFGVQAAVTLVLLVLLFRRFDWAAFRDVLRHISPAFYCGSLSAVVFGQLLYALRWRIVLGGLGVKVPYADVVRQYLMGIFFGNLMPTAVGGDAAKVYYLGRQAGYVEVGASLFVDRFLGFLWLALSGATLAWLTGATSPLFVLNRNLLTIFAVGFSVALAAAWSARAERWLPDRSAGWTARIREFAGLVRAGACRPGTLLASGGVVMAYVMLMTLVYTWYFAANGVAVPRAASVANVLVSMSIFVNVPISVNGIGLREQLHYLLFAALGLPKEISVSISLLVFSHFLLLSLAGYVVWLRARGVVARSVA